MKQNFLIITGGTGGHVIPAVNFANYLIKKNIKCKIIIDKRGYKYVYDFNGNINTINSSNLNGNILTKILGFFYLIQGFIQSLVIIILFKPTKVISFGSYASFFPLLSCLILKPFYKTNLYIHEQNSVIGRTNKFFLRYTDKIFLNFNILKKIYKYNTKTFVVGTPEKKSPSILELKKFPKKDFIIFIFGGSQGSEFITKFSVDIIKKIDNEKNINAKFFLQCPKALINKITHDLKKVKSQIVIKDYFFDIDNILINSSLAISRCGAGSINDLINFNIPSILIPLPTAKDNHQFYNASILAENDLAIIIDQYKDQIDEATNYIYDIYFNNNKTNFIKNSFDKIKVKNSNSLIYKHVTDEK